MWRRSQVAKASDCKSDIVGSTPTDASSSHLQTNAFAGGFFIGLVRRRQER